MTTTRKACQNCTTAKRKCIVQKPKCVRCDRKGLNCSYDLEPLQGPPTESDKLFAFGFRLSNHFTLGVCLIETVKNRSPGTDPFVCTPGRDNVTEIVRLGFQHVPELFRAGKPSSFVHPKLQSAEACNHLKAFAEGAGAGVLSLGFQALIQNDIQASSTQETLTALQAFLVHLAASTFSPFAEEREEADGHHWILSKWTQTLLMRVDALLPRSASPWQDWLLGESVRRTIFMAYLLNIAVSSFKHGHCSNWLFIESLPFDARPGLWMAASPQAWIAAARTRSGQEVGEQLQSYHEFAESFRGCMPDFAGDPFLTLVTLAHNGAGGN